MNQADFIAAVAAKTGSDKKTAEDMTKAVLAVITDTLKDGDEVRLAGFGSFATSQRAATTGRNPRTGETIQIAASTQAKFKAAKGLKDALNGS